MPDEQPTRTTQAGGCEIHYAERGSGPPLVMLHGSGGFRWDEPAFGGLARDYRVFVPSMPGFDRSTIGSVATGQDVADVVAAFVQQCAGGRANVVGESFGGRIAAWLAIRHPEVTERVVLAAPGGLRRTGGDRRLDDTWEEQYKRLFGRLPDRQPTEAETAQRRANLTTAIRLSGAPWDEELYQQLPSIKCPALVLYGSNDQTLSREAIQTFQERIPGARMTTFEGGPHVLSFALPEQFVAAVGEFLQAKEPLATR